MNCGGWDVVAAGDPSMSCDPAQPCSTRTWNVPTPAGSLYRCLQGHLSPPWMQQPLSSLAAFRLSTCPSKMLFPPAPQPCPVSAPPEKMSPLLTVLPRPSCRRAGRLAALLLTSPPALNLLLPEGQCSEAWGEKGTHLPSTLRSSPAHCCQLHLHCPGLGVEPCPVAPPCPTSRHVL
jgi:hypothetical protein